MWAVTCETGQSLGLGKTEKPVCGPGDVLVAVKAAGLNRADLLQRCGRYLPPPGASPVMGLECAGTIVETGVDVSAWQVGDRVCGLMAGGGYAEFALIDQGCLFAIPEHMNFEQAGALPEAMMTVWANIFWHGGFKSGDRLLIHGGTSGIGTMAIQMVRQAGADRIFITAGSADKCAYARRIGADVAINYREDDFETVVRASGGVDIVLDIVGGDYVQKNISVARPGGRIINIACMDDAVAVLNLLPIMHKRLVVTGTTLRARHRDEKRHIRDGLLADFWPAIASGAIVPVIDTVYPFSEAEAAQAHMARGGHIGKIMLSCGSQ